MTPAPSKKKRAARTTPVRDPLELLNRLARLATDDLELRPMLQRITDALADGLGIEFVELVRVDLVAGRFVCEALTSRLPTEIRIGYAHAIGSGVVGTVATSGDGLHLDDVSTYPAYIETATGVRSELCLPIKHRGEVVAILNLESPRAAAFRGHEALFTAVAEQLAGAIFSARLYEETRRRALYLEVLSEVSRTAFGSGVLRDVLGRISRYVQERFDLAVAAIVVANESGNEWEHRAIACRPGIAMLARKRWPVSAGIVGRAIRTGDPQLVLDTSRDADFFGLDRSITCEYVVPLRFQGRTLGAFNVESDDPDDLSEENLALFRTLAEQIVGPIELALVNQKLQRANSELAALARRDPLTGAANRRQFDEVLDAEWRRARRAHQNLALVIADVDQFKAYNDACGHQAGDLCLQRVAEALATVAHRAGDLVARYGGEEFAVILPGVDAAAAATLAESMRRAVEQLAIPHPASTVDSVITVSLGVSSRVPRRGDTSAALVHETDVALYRAKSSGRNRVASGGDATPAGSGQNTNDRRSS
ncbi:MAG: diguanylate cyclase [Thermoanaerobaculia bacterium]